MADVKAEDLVKYSEYFIVQAKIASEWQNKHVFKSYKRAKEFASFINYTQVRIDCFTPGCSIHAYVIMCDDRVVDVDKY